MYSRQVHVILRSMCNQCYNDRTSWNQPVMSFFGAIQLMSPMVTLVECICCMDCQDPQNSKL